jgi:hypothetical protein
VVYERHIDRRVAVLAAIVVVGAVVGSLAVARWSGQASPSSTPGHTQSMQPPSGSLTTLPAPTALPADTSAPTPGLTAAKGWPVGWQPDADGAGVDLQVGPDGTVYGSKGASEALLFSLDTSGHDRTGLLRLPDGRSFMPAAFGADGAIYVLESEDETETLYCFNPDGSPRYSWPTPGGKVEVMPTPSAALYVLAGTTLTLLAPDGSVRSSLVDDSITGGLGTINGSGVFVRPDDTLFSLEMVADGNVRNVKVYSPRQHALSTTPVPWDSMTMGTDGTVVAWRYDTDQADQTNIQAKDIVVAVLGGDGKPAAGWPLTVKGAVSRPVVGSDGSVYMIQLGSGKQPSRLLAIGQDGNARVGWPVVLPSRTRPYEDYVHLEPMDPVVPILGADGTVYVVEEDSRHLQSVIAYDSAGRILSRWPVALPARITALVAGPCIDWGCTYEQPLFVPSPSGHGLLYLHVGTEILALTEDGRVAPGWPKKATGVGTFDNWSWWAGTPDGGLLAIEESDTSPAPGEWTSSYALMRWTADGQVAY